MTTQARRELGYKMLRTVELAPQTGCSISQPLRNDDPHIYLFTEGKQRSHPREQTLLIHYANDNSYRVTGVLLYPEKPIFPYQIPRFE